MASLGWLGRNLNSNLNLEEKVLKTHQIGFQGFQIYATSHNQSLMIFRIVTLGF
jgi:hypothetical protein